MKSGRTLWDEFCYHYDNGVRQVRDFQKIWDAAEKYIDAERFHEVQSALKIQARDAVWWKDACLLYFQKVLKHAHTLRDRTPYTRIERLAEDTSPHQQL